MNPEPCDKADNTYLAGHGALQQMWELACQRSAARAALDLEGAGEIKTCTLSALMKFQDMHLKALMQFQDMHLQALMQPQGMHLQALIQLQNR